jgi:hypothetical protein
VRERIGIRCDPRFSAARKSKTEIDAGQERIKESTSEEKRVEMHS